MNLNDKTYFSGVGSTTNKIMYYEAYSYRLIDMLMICRWGPKKRQKFLAEPGGTLKYPWYCGMTQWMSGPQRSRQTKRRKTCTWVIFPSYYHHIPHVEKFLVYQAAASFRPVGSSVVVFIDQWRDPFWGSFGIAKGSADIQFILGILSRSLAPPMPVLSQPRSASSCWSLLQLHL